MIYSLLVTQTDMQARLLFQGFISLAQVLCRQQTNLIQMLNSIYVRMPDARQPNKLIGIRQASILAPSPLLGF